MFPFFQSGTDTQSFWAKNPLFLIKSGLWWNLYGRKLHKFMKRHKGSWGWYLLAAIWHGKCFLSFKVALTFNCCIRARPYQICLKKETAGHQKIVKKESTMEMLSMNIWYLSDSNLKTKFSKNMHHNLLNGSFK